MNIEKIPEQTITSIALRDDDLAVNYIISGAGVKAILKLLKENFPLGHVRAEYPPSILDE